MKTSHSLRKIIAAVSITSLGIASTLLALPQAEPETSAILQYSVSGVIVESGTGSGCPAAVYRIYSDRDSILPIISNVTDTLGRFSQPLDTLGNYRLVTEFIGTRPAERIFELTSSNPTCNLDTIPMSSEESTLGEVVVSVRKPIVESDGSTLTYNMDADDDSKSNNLLDMLRKVPMVSVDAEENIMVRGSKSFKILVNHKEDPMFSTGNIATILKAMPASSIKKIEVITEPGAKYDAEGTSGILNIITVTKQNLEGIFGNLNAWIGNNGVGANAYVRTKVKNVTGSANVYYSGYGLFPQLSEQRNEVFNSESLEAYHQLNESKTRRPFSGNNIGGQINLSWEPDTVNLFTTQFSVGTYGSTFKSPSTWKVFDANEDLVWSTECRNNFAYNHLSLSGQLSFQHTFRENHYITASYQYGYNNSYNDNISEYYDCINYPSDELYRKEELEMYYNRHVAQLDYALPVAGKHLFEAGAKGTFMTNRSMNTPFRGLSAETAKPIDEKARDTEQFQNIMALYATFRAKFGNFKSKVGVRYEYTDMGLRYKVGDGTDFSTRLNDIVPNASLTYNFSPASNLRLGYQMRISRPGLWSLNPYVNENSILSKIYGNPDLESEKTHKLSLSYTNYGGRLGGSVGFSYDYNGNEICDYIFSEGNTLVTTYANIGKVNQVGLNFNLTWNIIKDMNFNIYAFGYYKDMRAHSPELTATRNGWGGNFNANWDYRLPCKIRMSAYGGMGSGYFDIQYKSPAYYYYGIGISRGFLKDEALRLSANASTFLPPNRTWLSETIAENVRTVNWSKRQQWQVSFSISWNFGSLRADVKHTNADISGDDSGVSGNSKK